MALDVRTAVSFALAITVSTVIAQQPAPPGLPDQPQVIRTAAATVRVSAIKGFVYPWALAILPNGEMHRAMTRYIGETRHREASNPVAVLRSRSATRRPSWPYG
jgi:hypothetical protein